MGLIGTYEKVDKIDCFDHFRSPYQFMEPLFIRGGELREWFFGYLQTVAERP